MRKLLLLSIVLFTGVVFVGRLFYLQVYDTSAAVQSENNAIKVVYDYPQRGHIYDRNNKLIVSNQPSYDLMAIPREIKPFDTLEFCKLLNIDKEKLVKELNRARVYSPRLPSVIVPTMSKKEYAYLGEQMRKYEGFYIQKRSLRDYQIDFGANFLGYIQEVNQSIIDANPYYQSGDLIGRQGVEQQYEDILRGVKGVKRFQKDRFNRIIGSYKNGILDTMPVAGNDLQLTIDAELQKYGEELMTNKRGGIIALDPSTGEILALVSAPNYDPALLVGRERSKNFTKMYYDSISEPLVDRVLLGQYPPGSPFKALTALIGLQENVIDTSERISCHGGYNYGGSKPLGCHHHASPLAMEGGIANSCNAYFATVYRRSIEKFKTPQEGIDNWKAHLKSFGLGDFLGYDLPIGRPGFIPNSEFYNRSYQYPKYRWYATATISNAIGQGEVSMTPIQMANFTAAIANRGHYYKPHIIKKIKGVDTIPTAYQQKQQTTIDPKYFEPVVEGMHGVYNYGTASTLKIPGIEICGKTGTAENYTRIDGKRVQLTDHSTFVAFAPKDNPKIAIAVFVENGYWGSRFGGRIASVMIEKYLKGNVTRKDLEQWVMTHSLEDEYAKPQSGKPFSINDGKKVVAKFLLEKEEDKVHKK
ncbi:penicillin-binding protein 2 [Dokdonia sinensis]|uniref:Penicillin-binding protein 2 n=1 Tax=Dokdonia sinensis TaxID=2479847 RepID=A0A3M0GHE6_9FLAO|nr:penicillin-binding protein 2 [Dokdonia sinensis]RMB56756.1 penicillin-binding protein 2 [Dokdonia sinensis]